MDLHGRSAIITGANQGLGKAIAAAYIQAGANVMLCARNADLMEQTRRELAHLATNQQQVLAMACDVSQPEQAASLVQAASEQLGGVQILVNNAGVYGPKGEFDEVGWDEWVQAIEINLYGTLLPTRAMLPALKGKGYGKIINVSGGGATKPMPRLSAYAASKAAVVRFTETLAGEVRSYGIDVNAVAPGALNTRILDEVLAAGPDKVGESFYEQSLKQKSEGGYPVEKAAELFVFLASAESDGITGKLISAVWDPWRKMPEWIDTLNQSDVYTLRRIIPKERGLDWDDYL
jgi:NAD(P)-dependent dehydrogenase (short-subunit alcohol dehydrogenase family)